MFVLDTNVVSELRRVPTGKADPNVAEWATSTSSAQVYLSVVTIFELERGVLRAERRDPPQGAVLRRWLDDSVATTFKDRILQVDESAARQCALLHIPDPPPFRDALIGATALVHRMTVVTRNTKDFECFEGLAVLNPWE